MRMIALLALMAVGPLLADEDYSTALVIEAQRGTELRRGIFGGGVDNANTNIITVEFDGMRYTAEWQTLLPQGKNSASHFVVGSEVQARVDGKRLWVLRDDGKPLRVQITRREIVRDN